VSRSATRLQSTLTSFLKRLTLVGGGLLLGAGISEGLLRGEWADRLVFVHPHFISDTEFSATKTSIADRLLRPAIVLSQGGWEYHLKRDFRGRLMSSDFDVEFKTNTLGFRGSALHSSPTIRILALGDSFAMGFGVEEKDTFHAVLAERWTRVVEGDVESVNAGVVGYNPYNSFEAYLHLMEAEPSLAPDIALLQIWTGDDLCGASVPVRPASHGGDTGVARFKALVRSSRVAMIARDTLRNITPIRRALMDRDLINRMGISRYLSVNFAEACNSELTALGELFSRFRQISRQRGTVFIVVLIPLKEQVHIEDWHRAVTYDAVTVDPDLVDFDAPNRAIEKLAADHGLQLVDPTELLRKESKHRRLYFESIDPHMNSEGHAVVATALLEAVPTLYLESKVE